ncbi:hypothetical protein ACJJTC_006421 [Scirpophaga incertulas]
MEGVKPPKGLILSGPNQNYSKFKQMFLIYIDAAGLTKCEENRKIAIFLNAAGEEAVEVYNTFQSKIDTLEGLIQAFQNYIEPRKTLILNTYEFLKTKQFDGESIDHFITRLKILAKKCELENLEDRMITMLIILGVKENEIKECLLREADLNMAKAINIARQVEKGKLRMSKLQENENVLTIKKESVINCNRCGKQHALRACPAFRRKCAICLKYNHFASQCRNKKDTTNSRKKVMAVQEQSDCSSEDEVVLRYNVNNTHMINSLFCQEKEWTENIYVQGAMVKFKLDTGAECNTMPLGLFNKISNNTVLQNSNKLLVVYNGQKIKPSGEAVLSCSVREKEFKINFTVLDMPVQPILGLKDCVRLKLIQKLDTFEFDKVVNEDKQLFINSNKDIFTGNKESRVTTRSGRIIRTPIKLKDYIS